MASAPLNLVRATKPRQPSSPPARRRLGEILRDRGLISEQQLDEALRAGRKESQRLGEVLCANGVLKPGGLIAALETQWRLRRLDLTTMPPDPRLLAQIGAPLCLRTATMPWRRVGAATVIVTEDPSGFDALRERYEAAFGPILLALAGPGDIAASLATQQRNALVTRAETRVANPLSCRSWQAAPFCAGAALLGLAVLLLALIAAPQLLAGLLVFTSLWLAAVSGLKLTAALAQCRRPPQNAKIIHLHRETPPGRLPVISLLVPLFREERVAGHLLRRLGRLDYPRGLLDVCLVVEENDAVTRAALDRTRLPEWMRVVAVPEGAVKTKPRAMNYALDFCRGSIIGVYDAEDAPAPDQLRRVAAQFAQADPQVACLQGALDFYNTEHNWMSRCFTLEYATWFRVVLPGIARLGMAVPLGGTTLFFRRELLEHLGAWDAQNVTEDADLGIRLHRAGFRTELLDTVTEEEANARPWPWIKQRSRWLKGYAMTYAVHMRHPLRLWRDLGGRGFAGFQILFLGTLIQFAMAPLLWSLWLIPLGAPHPAEAALPGNWMPALYGLYLSSEAVNFALAARAMQCRRRLRLLVWGPLMTLYFSLASLAMYKALAEMFHKPFYWDKTCHGLFGGNAQHPAGPVINTPADASTPTPKSKANPLPADTSPGLAQSA